MAVVITKLEVGKTYFSGPGECCPICLFHQKTCTPENRCCSCLIRQLQEEDENERSE